MKYNGELIKVTVKVFSENLKPEIQPLPPWTIQENVTNNIYKVAGPIETGGEHRILNVTQIITLKTHSILTTGYCSVLVRTKGEYQLHLQLYYYKAIFMLSEAPPAAVCLLLKQNLNNSCSIQRLNQSVRLLPNQRSLLLCIHCNRT